MSRLVMSDSTGSIPMNVLDFSSPIYGSISTAQTHTEAIHFPIKVDQPEIQFDVVFSSEKDFEAFQKFVRNHQQRALIASSLLTLNWPARNILNWTGVIKQVRAGGMRYNYLPRARFAMDLVNSMVSSRTELQSVDLGGGWRAIYGAYGGAPALPSLTLGEAQYVAQTYGQNLFNSGAPLATPTPTGSTPVAPSPPGQGILTGS